MSESKSLREIKEAEGIRDGKKVEKAVILALLRLIVNNIKDIESYIELRTPEELLQKELEAANDKLTAVTILLKGKIK